MKKLFVIFFSILICLNTCICVSAVDYDRELYSIQLPDDYDWIQEESYISDNGSTFSVSTSDNTKEKKSIADMSKKDIEKHVGEMEQLSSAAMSIVGRDGKIEVVSTEKVDHPNGQKALVTVFKTTAKKEDGTVTTKFQKMYEFTGVKNQFRFTYTASDEKFIDDLDASFDSIVIKETEAESRLDKLGSAGILAVFAILICLGIARFIKGSNPYNLDNKKKKK